MDHPNIIRFKEARAARSLARPKQILLTCPAVSRLVPWSAR